MEPMLATPATGPAELPRGPEWAFEVKWDGVRALADTTSGRLRLWSRNEREITPAYPELAGLAGAAGRDPRRRDRPDGRRHPVVHAPSRSACTCATSRRAAALAARQPVTFLVFDVLRLCGRRRHPDALRRAPRDSSRGSRCPSTCSSPPSTRTAQDLWGVTKQLGLEGVVAKRRSSTYQPGRRSDGLGQGAAPPHARGARLRLAARRPTGSGRLGAVLFGARDADGALRFLGRAGSGLSGPKATADARAARGARAGGLAVRRGDPRPSTRAARAGSTRSSSSTPCTWPATPRAACASPWSAACAPTPTPTRGSSRDTRAADGGRRGPRGPRQPPREGHVPRRPG